MKNIQAQYQDLLEGRMTKANFMRNVRMGFPQFVSQTTSFDDSVKILKGKRILSEDLKTVKEPNPNAGKYRIMSIDGKQVIAKDFFDSMEAAQEYAKKNIRTSHKIVKLPAERSVYRKINEDKKPIGVYGHNPNAENDLYRGIDHVNYYQAYKGIQFELAKEKEITDETYVRVKEKVVKNILKDPDAYKDLQLFNFKAVKKMDKDLEMKEVKPDNHVDKANEMKVIKKDAPASANHVTKDTKKKEKVAQMTQTPKGKLEAFPTPGKEKVINEGLKGKFDSEDKIYTYDHLIKTDSPDKEQLKKVLDFIEKDKAELEKKGKKAKIVRGGTVPYLELLSPAQALKEHLLEDLTTGNDTYEEIGKGSRVKKKDLTSYDANSVGNVEDFDGHTALVKWDSGEVEHIQKNVLTKKDIPQHPEAADKFGKIPDSPFVKKEEEEGVKEEEASLLEKIKQKLFKAIDKLKKEGSVIATQNGETIGSNRNSAIAFTQARDLERKTGDQLQVIDTKSGAKRQV